MSEQHAAPLYAASVAACGFDPLDSAVRAVPGGRSRPVTLTPVPVKRASAGRGRRRRRR